MREPARAALDDVSEQLGEVLRRADRLLAEWSAFGTKVREQVDREARGIGVAVANSVDGAVRGVADTAIAERLAALTAELGRLEQRSRAAHRALVEERAASRRIAWIAIAGIVLANGLLAMLLLRDPVVVAPPPPPPSTEAIAEPIDAGVVEVPVDAAAASVPVDAPPAPVPDVTPVKQPLKPGTLPPRRK